MSKTFTLRSAATLALLLACNTTLLSAQQAPNPQACSESKIAPAHAYANKFARLVWAEEFNGKGLVDEKHWEYEEGLVRNEELQHYTVKRLANARQQDGVLILEAHAEKVENPEFEQGSKDWRKARRVSQFSSASINTQNRHSWQYGLVEVRAALPKGKGVWPAIWMMGENRSKVGWPKCGELDIMEYVSQTPKTIFATLHWFDVAGKAKNGHAKFGRSIECLDVQNMHVYALEWDEQQVSMYLDGKCYYNMPLAAANAASGNAFAKPFYILLNLAVGGSWGGAADASVYPQQFKVDYVRVFQK